MAISLAKDHVDAEVELLHLMSIPIDWIKLVENEQESPYPDITKKVKQAHIKLDKCIKQIENEDVKAKQANSV